MLTRLSRLQAELPEDASLLVSNPINIRYLSGFTGSNGLLIVNRQSSTLFTDSRYEIQASNEVTDCDLEIAPSIWESSLKQLNSHRLIVESDSLSLAQFDLISSKRSDLVIQKSTTLIEQFRLVKDEAEIDLIKVACEISTKALEQLISKKLIGKSELQIATDLERLMVDLGAQGPAFETIVAAGENSAIPHHRPTHRTLVEGDLLKIDFGAQYSGYKSDCTRTFVLGSKQEWQSQIHEAVLAGQSIGRELCKPGIDFANLDQEVRTTIDKSGYGDKFAHGLGHGVGLLIHEDPFLSAKTDGKIAQNMVITIEPGVYLANQGGVRIEDTGVVTDSGYLVLTEFPYELLELV